jgi:hypothetical protein
LEEAGKKLTNATADNTIVGQIVINLFEDSFEVKVTDKVDFLAIYAVALGIIEYLEKVGEDLDKVEKIMLQ